MGKEGREWELMYEKTQKILEEVNKVIRGKEDVTKMVFTAILAGGHILLEDVPGVGKTTLALAFSKALELQENRIQFTPDVLPSDVTGFSILGSDGEFHYKEGGVMCNLLLADEINRTSTKTQSALLEVMEEEQVTVDGVTRPLPKPFVVMATQNPVGSAGTQMLPESQLDRFLICASMGYPTKSEEIRMIKERQHVNPLDQVNSVVTTQELIAMQKQVREVFVDDKIFTYITSIVNKTRNNEYLLLGISPRGTLSLTDMSKAAAYISGRDYVLYEDVINVVDAVFSHRLLLNSKAKINNKSKTTIIQEIISEVEKPKLSR